jgi:hypothetical protein
MIAIIARSSIKVNPFRLCVATLPDLQPQYCPTLGSFTTTHYTSKTKLLQR